MANSCRLIRADDLYQKTFICEEPGDFRKAIENAPTVDAVEVVHGRWKREAVPIKNMDIVRYRDTCSECGAKVEFLCRDSHYNYCPYCDAKMDGGNEDGKM